jgi:hypothetical protein
VERQSEVVSQGERIKQSGALKKEAHVAPNAGEIFLARMNDILRPNANSAAVWFKQADHQSETGAFASATAAHDAERLALTDLERHILEDLSISKGLKYVLEFDCGRIAHTALLGKRKKMAFTRTTSTKMIRREDRTTLLVAACCTPSDPSSVV